MGGLGEGLGQSITTVTCYVSAECATRAFVQVKKDSGTGTMQVWGCTFSVSTIVPLAMSLIGKKSEGLTRQCFLQ